MAKTNKGNPIGMEIGSFTIWTDGFAVGNIMLDDSENLEFYFDSEFADRGFVDAEEFRSIMNAVADSLKTANKIKKDLAKL